VGGTQGTGTGGSTVPNPAGLLVLTDTNRDGEVDDKDTAGLTDWAWKGSGAFFIANVDDDDKKGKVDSTDSIVNGSSDEADLARIIIKIPADLLAKTPSVSVSMTTGAAQTHVFEKTASGWSLVNGALAQSAAQIELGLEALRFADADWDGFATLKVELLDAAKTSLGSQQVKMHVAPWIMLPNSAKTEMLYISSATSRLRPDLNKVLQAVGVPEAAASNPGRQDIWFQDTMEIGYTQLPGKPPMHVVMKAQRPNASDDVAITLLAPNFGFISIGSPRQPGNEEDHWMDWTGNLEVSHPVPGYPLGRIYYGKSDRTTFHPTMVKFLEAQQVQKPFALYTNWLVIQHVDEIVSFLPDKSGKAKMIIVSPAAANTVMGSGYDANNQKIQKYIDEAITLMKTELGLSDDDIIQIPTFFNGSGTNFAPNFSNPVNSVYANGSLMMGNNNTPSQIKADIEKKLSAIGVQSAWVDDAEYDAGGGNVHCATNTKKTPVCASFVACLP
jgi:protein-arginine deiminase